MITGASDGAVRMWDADSGDEAPRFWTQPSGVLSVALSSDGAYFASGGTDNAVRLWSVGAANDSPRRFEGHASRVNSVAFSPDGTTLVSGGEDDTVRLWQVDHERPRADCVPPKLDDVPPKGDDTGPIPARLELYQNYPNPFRTNTVITFGLIESAHVRLHIVDALGRHVPTVVDRMETQGFHEVSFVAVGLASGFYFYRVDAGAMSLTRPMQLIK